MIVMNWVAWQTAAKPQDLLMSDFQFQGLMSLQALVLCSDEKFFACLRRGLAIWRSKVEHCTERDASIS